MSPKNRSAIYMKKYHAGVYQAFFHHYPCLYQTILCGITGKSLFKRRIFHDIHFPGTICRPAMCIHHSVRSRAGAGYQDTSIFALNASSNFNADRYTMPCARYPGYVLRRRRGLLDTSLPPPPPPPPSFILLMQLRNATISTDRDCELRGRI